MNKPILCIDFDGVIHSYEKGWQNGEIYGNIVPGFFEWAEKAKEHFTLTIYSSRSESLFGRTAMEQWFKAQILEHYGNYDTDLMAHINFADRKPPAFLTIDDRAICFKGQWDAAELSVEALKSFKPWMQQGV